MGSAGPRRLPRVGSGGWPRRVGGLALSQGVGGEDLRRFEAVQGVDEGDARVQGGVDGADRFGVIDFAPTGLIVIKDPFSTNCPGTKAHGANL